jgi:hypothetical protein
MLRGVLTSVLDQAPPGAMADLHQFIGWAETPCHIGEILLAAADESPRRTGSAQACGPGHYGC